MRMLLLISGGIDSPVAGALALKAGHEIAAVHFHNKPFTDELNRQKAMDALQILAKIFNKPIRLYIINHGLALVEIARNCERKMNCVLCRRIMLRVASRIAEQEKCEALLTGESLAQVASQTLWNLQAEHSASSKTIVRPLLGMDKSEITRLAQEFGTFNNSIKPAMCCSIVPSQPATHASIGQAEGEEKKLDLDAIVQKALESTEVIDIKP